MLEEELGEGGEAPEKADRCRSRHGDLAVDGHIQAVRLIDVGARFREVFWIGTGLFQSDGRNVRSVGTAIGLKVGEPGSQHPRHKVLAKQGIVCPLDGILNHLARISCICGR